MFVKLFIAIAGLAVLLLAAYPATAQTGPNLVVGEPPVPVLPRSHIEIRPGRLLYRRCADWYELQNRPSGTVLYPQMRCWWVRG